MKHPMVFFFTLNDGLKYDSLLPLQTGLFQHLKKYAPLTLNAFVFMSQEATYKI